MQKSPFDAMTFRERQERWLEFQNTRLPYVFGSVDPPPKAESVKLVKEDASAPSEPPPINRPSAQQDFHAVRHRQYDAVIRRMQTASKKTSDFHTI